MASKDKYTHQLSELGKLPPQAIDFEVAVLGALLLEKEHHDKVIPLMPRNGFYKEEHNVIFNAIKVLYDANKQIDILTVTNQLRSTGELETVGGAYFVAQLTDKIGSSAHIEDHFLVLKEKWMGREVIRISSETIRDAYDDTADIFDVLSKNKLGFDTIDNTVVQHKQSTAFGDLIDLAAIEMNARFEQSKTGEVNGIPCPISKLDEHTGGWQDGDVIVLAGRPGMGKTAFALACAKFAAQKEMDACFFSLEMSPISLTNRLILGESSINPWNYRRGKLSDTDWSDFNEASARLKKLNLHIFDCPSVNINYIKAMSRIMVRKNKCRMIIIDYLQMMEAVDKKMSREQQVSEISRAVKGMARELNKPVLLLSQLSREVEKRGGSKKPQLSDLRESGAIEQDADVVIFPHRDDYYGIKGPQGQSLAGFGELIVAKGRNIGTTEVPFQHNDAITKFWDVGGNGSAMQPSKDFTSSENESEFKTTSYGFGG